MGEGFSHRETGTAAAVVFVTALAAYITVLAPSVTFEDSGELITAACTLGVPHEPGYPLFTMLGKLFTLVPIGDPAYRVNLMSAFFSALALVFGVLALFEGVRMLGMHRLFGRTWTTAALLAVAALVPGLGRTYISQSVITEVYGINNAFTTLLMWLLLRWYAATLKGEETRRFHAFMLYGLFSGLTVTNHHTSLIFLPFGFLFMAFIDRRFLLTRRTLLTGLGLITAGLLPYLYLYVASLAQPAMDWGDPENWTNFWRVVTRHQYGLDATTARTAQILFKQVGLHYRLLVEQFSWPFILLGGAGLAVLWRKSRPLFFASLLFNLLTGPLVAYVTNVDVDVRNPFLRAEQEGLVSVMYLPFYLWWGWLVGIGMTALATYGEGRKSRPVLVMAAVLLFGYTGYWGYRNLKHEDMSGYVYTKEFLETMEERLEPRSMVLANWDPFAFPVMYFQQVERRTPDMVFIDIELLRRSWYVQMLRRWYPVVMERSRAEVDAFLAAVKPFEDGEKFDANFIQSRYAGMIQSLIDRNYPDRPVYLTVFEPIRPLEPHVGAGYSRESFLVAQRLRKGPTDTTRIKPIDLSSLTDPARPKDRMANMLRNYYAIRLADRAVQFESMDVSYSLLLYERALYIVESAVIRSQIVQLQDRARQTLLRSTPAP